MCRASPRGLAGSWAPCMGALLLVELMFPALGVRADRGAADSPQAQALRISIDFPEEGFVFTQGQQVLVALKVAHCASAECGHIDVLMNGVQVSRLDLLPNEYGEIRAHVSLAELPEGDHVAAVMLVSSEGEALSEDLYADVGFSVLSSLTMQELRAAAGEAPVGGAEEACPHARMCIGDSQEVDCSGHGECVRGACVCQANWAGEGCSHAILFDNTFLPREDPQGTPSRCMKAAMWGQGAAGLMDSLLGAAEARKCDASQVLRFELRRMANVHYMATLLVKAVTEGRALVEEGIGPYNTSGFLLPLSACLPGEVQANSVPIHGRNDQITYIDASMEDSHYIPPAYRAYSHGVLWWYSQLVGFVIRPNERLLSMIRGMKNMIGYSHPVLGVQVRRGDSCAHAGSSTIRPPCQSIDTYIALSEKFISAYGYKQIFLATDDQEVVEQFRQHATVKVVSLPVDRGIFDSSFFIEYRLMKGYTDGEAVTRSTLLDLFLLAEADALVAGFGSHFGRMAFELSVYIKGYVPPYSSVDYPYCSHFKEKRPIG
eukprot:CAMPEP_0206213320 /NCGR_PEP_ID=MMETSP0047_2-20121206/1060_1 /ASSEMBLY_ACC=CAM_ASM_000192 /TAXON_ID=195065 /ORGANISM="Chroomonas mesostigmatica_cf, Strain CCMP1168" /LENGTH=544 /DNA_ID=CAMNT_0053635463 /DNA_START=142 /DNA_END=1774 /DNA_ORIENTATION=-